jgi:hypothetical protein
MSECRPHTGLSTCTCIACDLIRCGAVDATWDGWRWVELAGASRVILMRLTLQPPVRWGGPKTRWAGCVDWFRVIGEALDFDEDKGKPLDFDEAEGDDDDPVA